jgi:hypothetical protein
MLNMQEMKVRVTFTEPLLGTKPADPELHTRFVASKAPDHKTMEQEVAAHGAEEVEERGKTIFSKMEDGTPFLWNYQVEGFFKETCRILHKVPGSVTKKVLTRGWIQEIDNYIFVEGMLPNMRRTIPLYMPIDLDLTATDNQRPLRASTPQGERVALAHSEEAPAGTYIEFSVACFMDGDKDVIREWLDYGHWKGMGQWRNSGMGRFEWEEI